MKVENMTSNAGNKVANQFIITDIKDHSVVTVFQSYDSVIAKIESPQGCDDIVTLDEKYWDYSVTTGKYRNQFLDETKKETQAKIDSGVYLLADLN